MPEGLGDWLAEKTAPSLSLHGSILQGSSTPCAWVSGLGVHLSS